MVMAAMERDLAPVGYFPENRSQQRRLARAIEVDRAVTSWRMSAFN
jgi:hypothetical protein